MTCLWPAVRVRSRRCDHPASVLAAGFRLNGLVAAESIVVHSSIFAVRRVPLEIVFVRLSRPFRVPSSWLSTSSPPCYSRNWHVKASISRASFDCQEFLTVLASKFGQAWKKCRTYTGSGAKSCFTRIWIGWIRTTCPRPRGGWSWE